MKTISFAIALLAGVALPIGAQTTGASQSTPWAITRRGPNRQVWQRTVYEPGPDGKLTPHVHRYIELASGLNHWDAATHTWKASSDTIAGFPGGAVATNGQTQVIFANNLNTAGAIDMRTADGKRFQSHVLGISYYDTATGSNVWIGTIQNCQGVISSNNVVYSNAFKGISADVVYQYRRSGFSQDVVLRQRPPLPEVYGLNTASTVLQVWTEFGSPPSPRLQTIPARRTGNGLPDEFLDFGAMKIGRGKAISLGQDHLLGMPVSKQWIRLQGRRFLVEKVPIPGIAPQLDKLPVPNQHANLDSRPGSLLHKALDKRLLPSPTLAQKNKVVMKFARNSAPRTGFVLDYVTQTGNFTNFTFQGDTTYFISGNVNLYGTTTFEGGAVIKYTNAAVTVTCDGPIECGTRNYLPCVFTAKDDNTVGQTISGSSSAPAGHYGSWALLCDYLANSFPSLQLHNMEFKYMNSALGVEWTGSSNVFRNIQFLDDSTAFTSYDTTNDLGNILMANVGSTGFYLGGNSSTRVENLTVAHASSLCNDFSPPSSLAVTNSLLIGVTNWGDTFESAHNVTNSDETGIFQKVGAGAYYLTADSSLRNVGTTNIPADLTEDLHLTTTYPPVVYSNTTISVATTFRPQSQRDTDTPDLGYHYAPLDWVFGGVTASSNVTFAAGTVVGWFELPGSGGPGFGIQMPNGVSATFNGTVTSPCAFVRYSTVQEGGTGLWTDKGWLGGIIGQGSYDPNNPAVIQCRFTRFAHLANAPNHFRDYDDLLKVQATDCEFDGHEGGYNLQLAFTNCLFYRASILQETGSSGYTNATYDEIFRNCTFYGGLHEWNHWESSPYWQVSIRDCSFDGTTFNISPPSSGGGWYWGWLDADYNAPYNTTFVQNADLTALPGNSNVYLANGFNWQTGPLGDYYLPSNSPLIDKGDVTATQVGLYHFTTQTNLVNGLEVKEGTSQVDIGYHYVATDQYGNPIDTDGDGIPDYLEDANGNGVVDSGETDWQTAGDPGLQVWITQPKNNSTLP